MEDAVPELLHAVDDRHNAAVLPLVRILSRLARLIDVARRIAAADLLVVEWTELTEPATVGKQRDHQVDDETNQGEPVATDGDPARADAAPTSVRDLAGIEGSVASEAHGGFSCLVSPSANAAGALRRVSAEEHFAPFGSVQNGPQ